MGWLLGMACAWAAPAGGLACSAQPRILSIVAAQAGGSEAPAPPGEGWTPVSLPDDWSRRWPSYSGEVWYRIEWLPACPDAQGHLQPAALGMQWLSMAGEILLNGSLLWRDQRLQEPLSRSWNMPRAWVLPDNALIPGINVLHIRVVGVAAQTPGLGPLVLGEPLAVFDDQETRWWRQRTLFEINLAVSATLGLVFFWIWLGRRSEQAYGWYAAVSFLWVLFAVNILATTPWPFGDTLTVARFNTIALLAYATSFCMFVFRFAERSFPRLELLLWSLAALMAARVCLAEASGLRLAVLLGSSLAGILFLVCCLWLPWQAWRTRDPLQILLAGCLLLYGFVVVHDALILYWQLDAFPLAPFSALLSTCMMSFVLGRRLAQSMHRIDHFNEELRDEVRRARQALTLTLEQQHRLALENTRLQERLSLAHDLHDGLGGSLVQAIAWLEQDRQPMGTDQMVSLLKLLRNDLRQVVDHGASASMAVPETPTLWLAPVRRRFASLFEALGVQSQWQLPPAWPVLPAASQCLALTRVIEEALTNILKHSRARHVGLTLAGTPDGLLQLSIRDDGVGFDAQAVEQAGWSIGMRSMRARMHKLGGTFEVSSAPGRTEVTATLRLKTLDAGTLCGENQPEDLQEADRLLHTPARQS